MKIYRRSQSIVKAYHGTCEGYYKLILEDDGLRNPYLTRDIDIAKYYANEASINYKCGKPIILEVSIPNISNLRYDKNSMDEPIFYEGNVQAAWDKAEQDHPEWVKDDIIYIPSSEWEISWNAVGAVLYNGVIPSEYTKVVVN
jgi:hypothetical protein